MFKRDNSRGELLGYIAATGIKKAGRLKPDELIRLACEIFGTPNRNTVSGVAEEVRNLGKQRRRHCCRKYRKEHNLLHPQATRRARAQAKAFARNVAAAPTTSVAVPAPNRNAILNFYDSWEWKRLAYDVKMERGRTCECCGTKPSDGVRIVTDHIKPIRYFWNLRLDRSNLQVLCNDCNMGKGSWDQTDWRPASARFSVTNG